MSEYTEGPWELIEIKRNKTTIFRIRDKNNNVIGQFFADNENYERLKKVVQLIAAAPELLEAAEKAHKKLLKMQDLLSDEGYESFKKGMNFAETVELEQVIKKVKGVDDNS